VPGAGNPLAWNRYAYTLYNPLRYVDPSGNINEYPPNKDKKTQIAEEIALREKIEENYNLEFEGYWTIDELMQIMSVLSIIASLMGGYSNFQEHYGNQTWLIRHHTGEYAGCASPSGYIELKAGFSDWTLAHEFGHALDFASGGVYRKALQLIVGAGKDENELWKIRLRKACPECSAFWYDPGTSPPVNGVDANFNAAEDFAESFAAVILTDKAAEKGETHFRNNSPYDWVAMNNDSYDFRTTPRGMYVLSILRRVP